MRYADIPGRPVPIGDSTSGDLRQVRPLSPDEPFPYQAPDVRCHANASSLPQTIRY